MFKNPITIITRHQRHYIVLALLILSCESLVLITIRFFWASPNRAYVFLVWNLFLAWIPYLIGLLLLIYRQRFTSVWTLSPVLLLWLLFFPNAPYIATDFFHFDQKPYIPVWFDLIMLFSFALNGLLLGLVSLRDVHIVIEQNTNRVGGWLFVAVAILFGAAGVYAGRYLRWNTWDVFSNPVTLANDLLTRFIEPSQDWRAWGVTLAFSSFLGVSYVALMLLMKNQSGDDR